MDNQRAVLTERITFAEDWLARARRQVDDGEQARGILTLLLAEAEVHRARELGTGRPGARTARGGWAFGPVAAVVSAAVIVGAVALWRPFEPAGRSAAAAGEVSPHPIVTLAAGTGTLLNLVRAPEEIRRTVTVLVPVRVTVSVPASLVTAEPANRHVAATAPVRPAAVAQPAQRGPEAAAVVAVPPVAPETSALLSEAELIDLVLATERSLRRTTNQ
ncbi:MAG: hypothetical protein ACRDGN_10595 [bacterium]